MLSEGLLCLPVPDVIKLQLVEAGLVECLLEVVAQTVDGEREEDIAQLKTASDLMVLLLLGGMALLNTVVLQQPSEATIVSTSVCDNVSYCGLIVFTLPKA